MLPDVVAVAAGRTIHAAFEKRVARVSNSMHACGSVPIVMILRLLRTLKLVRTINRRCFFMIVVISTRQCRYI